MTQIARRQFLAQTAALAAAPLIAGVSNGQTPARKLGVALCGLGSLSTNQIAPALLKTRNCRLAGIVTGTPSKAAEWQKKYALPASSVYSYDTMHEMAKNKDIDIVYVVTPNALHLPHTLAAAAAGKHVFCEKPLEISVERCQQMIDACKKAGVMLGVGYRCQFEPNHLECVRLARDKVLGDVRIIDANFGFAIGDPTQWRLKRDARRRRRAHGRRHLLPADHADADRRGADLDQRDRGQDRRREVQGSRRNHHVADQVPERRGRQLHQHLLGQRPAGLSRRDLAWLVRPRPGVLLRRQSRPAQRRHRDQHSRWRDQFALELDDFADCIINKRPTKVPGEMGLADVKYLMAIYESIKKGRPVSLV